MKKNKTILYVSVAIFFLVLGGGVWIVKSFIGKPQPQTQVEESPQTLPPADASINVDLQPQSGNKAVVLTVTNIPTGTTSIEYELSYLTGEGLPKGAIGKVDVKSKTELVREILLGTCSRNVCTYDQGVEKVNLVLRFNHPDGASQFSKEYPLE